MARLAHAMTFVSDIEAMVRFYGAALGYRRALDDGGDPGFAMLEAEHGADLALHQLPAQHVEQVPSTGAILREDTSIKLCFEVSDLAATRQAIVDGGGSARAPWVWNDREFCECGDPEGNVLQIFRRLG